MKTLPKTATAATMPDFVVSWRFAKEFLPNWLEGEFLRISALAGGIGKRKVTQQRQCLSSSEVEEGLHQAQMRQV